MTLLPLIAFMLHALLPVDVSSSSDRPVTEDAILEEINSWREAHDLEPLELDRRLSLAAADRITDMEERAYWGHQHPTEGGSPFVWLRGRGYVYRAAGENLAAGFETAHGVVASWMSSPGHRANILSPEFEDVGIAWIDGGTTRRLTGRSVVVLFARER